MTRLTKTVRRLVELRIDNRAVPRNRDHFEVALTEEKTIRFRPKGCRKSVELPLATVLTLAYVEASKAERGARRKGREHRRAAA